MDKETIERLRATIEAEQGISPTEKPEAREDVEGKILEPDLEEVQEYRLTHGFDRFGRTTMHVDAVKVGDRLRVDMGDLEDLAQSIFDNWLLQPIVLDNDDNLVAGGRRTAAFKYLLTNNRVSEKHGDFTMIPYVRFGDLSPGERRLLELEENVKRKEMTWQERIIGIADYHRLSDAKNMEWSQAQTGRMLGITQGYVSTAVNIANLLKNKEHPIWKLGSVPEAVKYIAALNYDAAALEQARRIQAKRALAPAGTAVGTVMVPQEATPSTPILPGATTPVSAGGPVTPTSEASLTVAKAKVRISKETIASMFVHGNFIDQLLAIRKITTINHIITDPPYAIDMDNIENSDRVKATHQIEQNKKDILNLLTLGFDVIQPDGFLCMWYDLDMHQQIIDWADKIGWRVCHWPLTWCKSSNCVNKSSQFNVTKATEHMMFLRRSEQSTIKKKQAKNYFVCDAISSPTHPFVKPDMCWRYPIETVSIENQVIVDPFCGEGSMFKTGFAMNRQVIGSESDEVHIAHGIDWLYNDFNQIMPDMILDESQMPI